MIPTTRSSTRTASTSSSTSSTAAAKGKDFKGVVVVRTVMPNQNIRRKTSSSYSGDPPYQN